MNNLNVTIGQYVKGDSFLHKLDPRFKIVSTILLMVAIFLIPSSLTNTYYLLGFSLGSFLLREYFTKYKDEIAGAIIMGTGHQPAFILNIIMKLVQNEIKKVGYDATTDFVRNLSFGQYNKKFKPNRTKMDWLCANEDQLDKYMNDNLCRKDISAGLFYDLLNSMKKCGLSNTYENWNQVWVVKVFALVAKYFLYIVDCILVTHNC